MRQILRSNRVLTGVVVSVLLLLAGASACKFLCNCDHGAAVEDVVSGCHQQEADPEVSRSAHSDTHDDCACCTRTCLRDTDVMSDRSVYLASAPQNSPSHGLLPAENVEILSSKAEPSARDTRLLGYNRGSPAYILNSSLLF